MRVKCLAQEHNAVPRPGPPDPESSALTIRPPRRRLSIRRYRRIIVKYLPVFILLSLFGPRPIEIV